MRRNGLSEWPEQLRGAAWHDLQRIADEAGVIPDIQKLGKLRYRDWLTVRDWKSNARFPGNAPSNRDLSDLFLAVNHERGGVFGWLESIFQKSRRALGASSWTSPMRLACRPRARCGCMTMALRIGATTSSRLSWTPWAE